MHIPLMMSVLMVPITVVNVGIVIQIAAIAAHTRRLLTLSCKTSNYLVFRLSTVLSNLNDDDDDDDDDDELTIFLIRNCNITVK